jgi:hypothetical protein
MIAQTFSQHVAHTHRQNPQHHQRQPSQRLLKALHGLARGTPFLQANLTVGFGAFKTIRLRIAVAPGHQQQHQHQRLGHPARRFLPFRPPPCLMDLLPQGRREKLT